MRPTTSQSVYLNSDYVGHKSGFIAQEAFRDATLPCAGAVMVFQHALCLLENKKTLVIAGPSFSRHGRTTTSLRRDHHRHEAGYGESRRRYHLPIQTLPSTILTSGAASASDDSIHAVSNRGNKRKKRAKYVQQGRLDQADGPRTYRRVSRPFRPAQFARVCPLYSHDRDSTENRV